MGLLKSLRLWRQEGDDLFDVGACAAAILTFVSWVLDRRPSEVVSGFASFIGADAPARWFSSDAPPILALRDPVYERTALGMASLILLLMTIKPFTAENAGPRAAYFLVTSRAAGTLWLALGIAAQVASSTATSDLNSTAGVLVMVSGSVFLGALVCSALCQRRHDATWTEGRLRLILTVVVSAVIVWHHVLLAILFAALRIPISAVMWLLNTDGLSRRRQLDRDVVVAEGAKVVEVNSSLHHL